MEPHDTAPSALGLESLPAEILIQIVCQLDPLSFGSFLNVSRSLSKLSRRQEALWSAVLHAHFGPDWESGFKSIPTLDSSSSNMGTYCAMAREMAMVFSRMPGTANDPTRLFDNLPMRPADTDAIMRIAVIGEEKPGKSSLIFEFENYDQKLLHNADLHPSVLRAVRPLSLLPSWLDKNPEACNNPIHVMCQIFDIFSGERLFHIPSFCHRGAHGFVFVFDLTRESTFAYLETYAKDIEIYQGFNYQKRPDEFPIVVVVGTHHDQRDQCTHLVPQERIRALCISIGAIYLETSIVTRRNIDEVFLILASRIWRSKFWRERLTDPKSRNRVPPVRVSNKSRCSIQ